MKICSVEDCERKAVGLGFCDNHYRRFKRNGTTEKVQKQHARNYFEEQMLRDTDECFTWPFNHVKGYGRIKLNGKNIFVHRLSCELTFGPEPEGKPWVRHICGNGHLGCFNPKHVVWGTYQENSDDRVVHETLSLGKKHHNTKLTEEQVSELYEKYQSGRTGYSLAKEYGVADGTIYSILNGHSWYWVTGVPRNPLKKKKGGG